MINWRKIWYFIWKDDSLASWFVNIILAVILIKFIIYPGIGFLLSTDYPVVAVVSCSMEHKVSNCGDLRKTADICGNANLENNKINFDKYWELCGGWYSGLNINKEMFKDFPFKNGFNKGDIMVLIGSKNIKIGDVIVFDSGYGNAPIIHRVVNVEWDNIMTKGDHNVDQMIFEKNIKREKVFGKAVIRIPYLGWVKVIFNNLIGGVLK